MEAEPSTEYEIALAVTPAPEQVPYDDEQRLGEEIIGGFLDGMIATGANAEELGRALAYIAYLKGCPYARTYDDLARIFRTTKGRVSQLVEPLNRKFGRFTGVFGRNRPTD